MRDAAELSERLAARVLDVCRTYLSNGHREGRYWLIGDVYNATGRSMYVRLTGPLSGPGAAGKWTDAATGQHGDLLDLIRLNKGHVRFQDLRDEVLTFLALPSVAPFALSPVPTNGTTATQRLFAAGRPVPGTLAESYLRARGLTCSLDWDCLRFHPSVYYRDAQGQRTTWPALLAAVTTLQGDMTGLMRTYLDPHTAGKAPVSNPRRAMGMLAGHGIRFGSATTLLVVGEGIETILALKSAHYELPMLAATSAAHLAQLILPSSLTHLIIAADNDAAGQAAAAHLTSRTPPGCQTHLHLPDADDWNTMLLRHGAKTLHLAVPQP